MPIIVDGQLWGVVISSSTREEPLPADTEARLAIFTELVATAIANAEARLELRGFGAEQAALRRVATLVARGALPEELFAAATAEVGRVLGVDHTALSRYEPDGSRRVVGAWARYGSPVRASGKWQPVLFTGTHQWAVAHRTSPRTPTHLGRGVATERRFSSPGT